MVIKKKPPSCEQAGKVPVQVARPVAPRAVNSASAGNIYEQKYNTFNVGRVGRETLSNYQLSGHQPNGTWYSLSTLSTVPYVQLVGAQGFEKIFSWGEPTWLPPGANAKVGNASYHDGDIFINGGKDYQVPPRVTFPIQNESALAEVFTYTQGIDVRRCTRAWFVIPSNGALAPGFTTYKFDQQLKVHSGGSNVVGVSVSINAPMDITYFPLGIGTNAASALDVSHALLDVINDITVVFDNQVANLPRAYIVLEYGR